MLLTDGTQKGKVLIFKNLDKRDLFLVAFFSGLLLILCSIYFMYIIPINPVISNHSNLNSTILSLELLNNKNDLFNLIGTTDDPRNQVYSDLFIKSVDMDNFYIFIYSLYFLSLFEIGFRFHSFSNWIKYLFYFDMILCMLFDFFENYKILTILNAGSILESEESIQNLRIISLSKWSFLFIMSGGIGVLFWLSKEKILLKMGGVLLFTSFVTFIPGLFRYRLIEIASYLLFFGLLFSWIYIIQLNYYLTFRK